VGIQGAGASSEGGARPLCLQVDRQTGEAKPLRGLSSQVSVKL
jgi:hypothetical protein